MVLFPCNAPRATWQVYLWSGTDNCGGLVPCCLFLETKCLKLDASQVMNLKLEEKFDQQKNHLKKDSRARVIVAHDPVIRKRTSAPIKRALTTDFSIRG